MKRKAKGGLWMIAITAPILLGSIAKGQEAKCTTSSTPGDTFTTPTPATAGQPGVFGGSATVTAPPLFFPITDLDTSQHQKPDDDLDFRHVSHRAQAHSTGSDGTDGPFVLPPPIIVPTGWTGGY